MNGSEQRPIINETMMTIMKEGTDAGRELEISPLWKTRIIVFGLKKGESVDDHRHSSQSERQNTAKKRRHSTTRIMMPSLFLGTIKDVDLSLAQ
jgi:hypothetical protein